MITTDYMRQAILAEKMMAEMLERTIKEYEEKGYKVTVYQDEIIVEKKEQE